MDDLKKTNPLVFLILVCPLVCRGGAGRGAGRTMDVKRSAIMLSTGGGAT